MKVKICGVTNLKTAQTAIENGADALGFVFAESKRKIEPQKAKKIIQQLPKGILKVGVFVNDSISKIESIVTETGINVVQLHGDEPPLMCESISVPVIKALGIRSKEDFEKIHEYRCEYILLDSPKRNYQGGNGMIFDWSLLSSLISNEKKIILAGGLNEDNVAEIISIAHPYMVDVSSGVETNGKKDNQKIKAFIETAKMGEEFK